MMPPMREFCAPWPLIAVAVLGVNDAWLKPMFHNSVTGKLSDFAGCFFLPLFVSALLSMAARWSIHARMVTGVVVTLAIFVPVSVSRDAADAFCAVLAVPGSWLGFQGYRIAADATDLMALPMVACAWWYGLRRGGENEVAS